MVVARRTELASFCGIIIRSDDEALPEESISIYRVLGNSSWNRAVHE